MSTHGNVKWFDPKKGYGFILGPEGQDVFVHYSQIEGDGFRSLKDGEEVDYQLLEGEKGFQAKGVNPVVTTTGAAEMVAGESFASVKPVSAGRVCAGPRVWCGLAACNRD